MSILVISDLHYEKKFHHTIDESMALKWLKKKLKRIKPDALIGLGDLGSAWTAEDWKTVIDVVNVCSIYGNHDNLELLSSLTNSDKSNILAKDGEMRLVKKLRFGFVNGIVANDKKEKEGIPRKNSTEYQSFASQLSGVDVLCTHESPIISSGEHFGYHSSESPGPKAVQLLIESVNPVLALSGHTSGSYESGHISNTVWVRVDTSQHHKHYALIQPEENSIEIWNDENLIEKISIPTR